MVIYSFAFPHDEKAMRCAVPGMLWVAIAFTGTIALGRAFDRERENDTMRALLLSPVPRLAVFLGKAVAMAVLILAVAVVVAPLLALFLDAPLFDIRGELALVVLLGAVGIAIIGSVFAATLLKVRSRDVLLPVILYPLLVPLFVAGTKTTAALVADHPNLEAAWYWIDVPRNLRRRVPGTFHVGLRVPGDRMKKLAVPILAALGAVGFVVSIYLDLHDHGPLQYGIDERTAGSPARACSSTRRSSTSTSRTRSCCSPRCSSRASARSFTCGSATRSSTTSRARRPRSPWPSALPCW